MNPQILFIHPPVVKPSEPPAGLGRLSACLYAHGIPHEIIDMNLEGLEALCHSTIRSGNGRNRWDLRACKNLETNLAAMQRFALFRNNSRYSRAVRDINHVLALAGKPYGIYLSLADYTDSRLLAVNSKHLRQAAETPEANLFYPYFAQRLEQALAKSPEYIGFSINFLSQALCAMAMIGFIKKIHPRQKIILGGSLITSWVQITGRQNLFTGLADEIVAGPGEEKLLRLLGSKETSDKGPSADYRLLETNSYLSPGFVLPFSAASGCWWRKCAFCPETAEGNPYRPLSIERISDDLSVLSRRSRPALIHLLDSSLAPSLLKTFISRPPGAPWYGFARITKHLTDEDFCRALKKSGCMMLQLGIESGDQTVLDALNKGMDLQDAVLALKNLKKAGIAVYGYFLFGTPAETQAGAYKTLDFVSRYAECFDFLNLAVFNLPITSTEAENLHTQDFYDGDLSLYKNFSHPHNWQRPQIRLFLEKVFKKHPSVAPIVRRTPEFFTSNHAPFFVLANQTDKPMGTIAESVEESDD